MPVTLPTTRTPAPAPEDPLVYFTPRPRKAAPSAAIPVLDQMFGYFDAA